MKKPRVFISYSHSDSQFVDKLASKLKATGVDVWIDKWNIKIGDSITRKINEGISASDFLIVILSCTSVNSPWVREELNAATIRNIEQEKHAFILPVLLEDCEIPALLQHRRYANFKDNPGQAFQELLEVIRVDAPTQQSFNHNKFNQRILKILRDPIWQMVGAVIAIAALLWAVYIYLASGDYSVPTPTSTVIETLSSQPIGTPIPEKAMMSVKLLRDTFVYEGPGTEYTSLSTINENTKLGVIARNPKGSWWQIFYPDGKDGLAWIDVDDVEITDSNPSILPTVIVDPPTPTSTSPPKMEYVGMVVAQDNNNFIQGALVIFKFPGHVPIDGYTDTLGTYRFHLAFSGDKLIGRVEVRKDGFAFFDREITLERNNPTIQDIRLVRNPETTSPIIMSETPTATIVPTNSPEIENTTTSVREIVEPTTTIETSTPTITPSNTPPSTFTPVPTEKADFTANTPTNKEMIRSKDGADMVYVDAGKFNMGADINDSDARDDEFPSHVVYLDAFWIDKFEITIALYQECARAGVCNQLYIDTPEYSDLNWSQQLPMINVSWNDAQIYCEWVGGRLPTEAEWEKAAKGVNGNIYPWGNKFEGLQANYCDEQCGQDHSDKTFDDGFAFTSPVGYFQNNKSTYGAYDMAGNVWEWVEDWYDGYPSTSSQSDYFGEKLKVYRGGSWYDTKDELRTTRRGAAPPDSRAKNFGFRCVVLSP